MSATAGRNPAAGGRAGAPEITVTVWHNVAVDAHCRRAAVADGYQPFDPVVRVFACQAQAGGRTVE